MFSLLDSTKELNNKRAMRKEKNELCNIKRELEETLMRSLEDGAVRLTDEQWDKIEDSIEVADKRIFEIEQIFKNKKRSSKK